MLDPIDRLAATSAVSLVANQKKEAPYILVELLG